MTLQGASCNRILTIQGSGKPRLKIIIGNAQKYTVVTRLATLYGAVEQQVIQAVKTLKTIGKLESLTRMSLTHSVLECPLSILWIR